MARIHSDKASAPSPARPLRRPASPAPWSAAAKGGPRPAPASDAAAGDPAAVAGTAASLVASLVASEVERLRETCADEADLLGALQSAAWKSARGGREEAARLFLRHVFGMGHGRSNEAWRMLGLGGEMERAGAYEAATDCYRRGLLTEELATGSFDGGRLDRRVLRYFLRNNLAYCLAVLGLGVEAEPLARQAIAVDPRRHNAHKNLGLALRLQGRLAEAAACFAKARDLCPADGRAAALLEAVEEEMARDAR